MNEKEVWEAANSKDPHHIYVDVIDGGKAIPGQSGTPEHPVSSLDEAKKLMNELNFKESETKIHYIGEIPNLKFITERVWCPSCGKMRKWIMLDSDLICDDCNLIVCTFETQTAPETEKIQELNQDENSKKSDS